MGIQKTVWQEIFITFQVKAGDKLHGTARKTKDGYEFHMRDPESRPIFITLKDRAEMKAFLGEFSQTLTQLADEL